MDELEKIKNRIQNRRNTSKEVDVEVIEMERKYSKPSKLYKASMFCLVVIALFLSLAVYAKKDENGKFIKDTLGININTGTKSFTINTERELTSEYFSFTTTDDEYHILKKIRNTPNTAFLKDNADFALGIVTGNNKEYISHEKSAGNEMVLKGSDISKYHINQTNNYIIFNPESFQQVAPTEIYRAEEKLLYRFISSQLVFAYDDKQTLSLNSCNIVIPKIAGTKMKYVMAILNSRIAQFIYKREFNSVKVLRSHIENIPIPLVDSRTQDKIIELTNKLISGLELKEAEIIYDELDILISEIFELTSSEMEIIKKAVDGENKFLA